MDEKPLRRSSSPGTYNLLQPLERFLHIQASSGIVLLLAGALALFWANSRWGASYTHLWHTPLTVGVGDWVFAQPLHFWVNEGLMTIFFLVVGLEIKRELHEGVLASVRAAALPVAAAISPVQPEALAMTRSIAALLLPFAAASAIERAVGATTGTELQVACRVA